MGSAALHILYNNDPVTSLGYKRTRITGEILRNPGESSEGPMKTSGPDENFPGRTSGGREMDL